MSILLLGAGPGVDGGAPPISFSTAAGDISDVADWALTNAQTTAERIAGTTHAIVRSATGVAQGTLKTFKFTYDVDAGVSVVGFTTAAQAITATVSFVGQDVEGFGVIQNGTVITNGDTSGLAAVSAFTAGDEIEFELDLTTGTKTARIRINGGAWSGTYNISAGFSGGPLYPSISTSTSAGGPKLSLNGAGML